MIKLLERLIELDPDICQVVSKAGDVFRLKILPDQLGWHWIYVIDGQISLRDTAVLQFAVQQALDARILSYNIRRRHPNAWKGVRADGFAVDVFLGDRWLMNDIYYPSLAAALLSAYLNALEAVTKKG